MKARYIIWMIVAIYLAILVVAIVFVIREEPEIESTPTPTATEAVTPIPTAVKTQCEQDRDNIQTALDTYHEANNEWPTADGQPGDIVWEELVPEYMREMPGIDGDCDWQVSGNPEGNVCVAHTC